MRILDQKGGLVFGICDPEVVLRVQPDHRRVPDRRDAVRLEGRAVRGPKDQRRARKDSDGQKGEDKETQPLLFHWPQDDSNARRREKRSTAKSQKHTTQHKHSNTTTQTTTANQNTDTAAAAAAATTHSVFDQQEQQQQQEEGQEE